MRIKNKSKQKLKGNLRWHALILLHQIEDQGKFSHQLIQEFLNQSSLSSKDKDLLVNIVYGVTQRRLSLDYLLKPYLKNKTLETWVHILLKMSVYQIEYLDRIPSHAIVNEAVTIAKTNGHQGLANLVNGVLRNYLRKVKSVKDDNSQSLEALSYQYSIPLWLLEYFQAYLSESELKAFAKSLLEIPKLTVRIHPQKASRSEIIQGLQAEDIIAHESHLSDLGLIIESGNIFNSAMFKEGYITIQDESSMLVAAVGQIKGDESILDACSAPGGKATHMASLLDQGHLRALDLSQEKINLVEENMKRMDLLDKVDLQVCDALKFIPNNDELYDIIFIDAPCSGLGLMRRKPEIKYNKSYEDILALAQIQQDLLQHLSQFVKPQGYIVYSTCTLSFEENEDLVHKFVSDNPQFQIDPIRQNIPDDIQTQDGFIRLWPHQYGTDGFFISRLKKIK